MFKTTFENLVEHLQQDMKITEDSIVWLHSGTIGLGIVQGGVDTITDAFSHVLTNGALVIPSFTYSWCNEEVYDKFTSECSGMGAYGEKAWKDKRFKRNDNPNFAVSIMDQTLGRVVEKSLISNETKLTCFGPGSVFDKIYRLSFTMPSQILLLGGAHNDVVFRTTFLHYIEQKIGVPYRYVKSFQNPLNTSESVDQLVRYISKDEYISENGDNRINYSFPINQKYQRLGKDLMKNKMIHQSKFGYSDTRSVPTRTFCEWLEVKIKQDSEYLLK